MRRSPVLRLAIAAALAAAVATSHAGERTLYRSVLPGGATVYADAPVSGASEVVPLNVEMHAADPRAAAEAQAQGQRRREAMLKAFEERSKRVRELQVKVDQADSELQAMRASEFQASEVREGDRQGRRWTSQYGQRQMEQAAREERAASCLAGLRSELAALQP